MKFISEDLFGLCDERKCFSVETKDLIMSKEENDLDGVPFYGLLK